MSLADNPKVQRKLRNEILSLGVDTPTMDQLNSLPYLENVIRESLRFHSIIATLERVVAKDDVIPVETPYKDRYGQMRHHIT